MKKRGFSMVLLCLMLLLLIPQAASAKSHWSFYAGVTPTYSYVQPYPYYGPYYAPYYAPYYGYPAYSPYYFMYPRHEWGHAWHEHHEHHEHHH
jgi:hypothetical protein